MEVAEGEVNKEDISDNAWRGMPGQARSSRLMREDWNWELC